MENQQPKWGSRKSDEPSWTPAVVVGAIMIALLVAACWMSGLLDWLLDIKMIVVTAD